MSLIQLHQILSNRVNYYKASRVVP